MKKLFLLLICLVLSGCQDLNPSAKKETENRTSMTTVIKAELASLNLQNPNNDLENNFYHGDKRFISICGYACVCPGVNEDDYNFIEQYGSRIIEGTSDVIESEEHSKLIEIATKYAENYNQNLIKKLKREQSKIAK